MSLAGPITPPGPLVVGPPPYTSTARAPQNISGGAATFRFVLAWAVVLLLLGLANRTRLGHVLIYYALALSLLFLLVTQYQWLANVLQPAAFTLPAPTTTTPATAGTAPIVAAVGGSDERGYP